MTSKEEVIKAIKELEESYLLFLSIEENSKNIELEKIKAQKRLSLARDNLRSIKL